MLGVRTTIAPKVLLVETDAIPRNPLPGYECRGVARLAESESGGSPSKTTRRACSAIAVAVDAEGSRSPARQRIAGPHIRRRVDSDALVGSGCAELRAGSQKCGSRPPRLRARGSGGRPTRSGLQASWCGRAADRCCVRQDDRGLLVRRRRMRQPRTDRPMSALRHRASPSPTT